VKIVPNRPYAFQVYQKHISRISVEKPERFMIALNRIVMEEGLEDVKDFRQDSAVYRDKHTLPAKQLSCAGLYKREREAFGTFERGSNRFYSNSTYKQST
jgi:hypothetical protein